VYDSLPAAPAAQEDSDADAEADKVFDSLLPK
jgi:hypothetical protein